MVDVSIVVPIYNTPESYLKKNIESIIQQSKFEIEIILVNDGSTNNALDICNSYAKIDDRIVIIDQVNLGVSVARNVGMDKAKGNWVTFIDPDDWIDNKYIESLFSCTINNAGADIIIGNCYINEGSLEKENDFLPSTKISIVTEKNILMGQLVGKKISKYYPQHMAVGVPWGKLFDRKFLSDNNIKFIPGMIRMQDNIFSLYAFFYSKKIVFTPARGYHYRKEANSVSFSYNPNIVQHFEKYFFETEFFIRNKLNSNKRYMNSLLVKRLTSFNSYLKYYILHPKNSLSRREKKKLFVSILNMEGNKKAINELDFSYCNNYEKIFIFLLRKRFYDFIMIIYSLFKK